MHKSYPKMEQIEKWIKDFENDIGAHLEDKGGVFPVGPGEPCFRLKITVSRTQYSKCLEILEVKCNMQIGKTR